MVNVSCVELPDETTPDIWGSLANHVEENSSEILVLNEMPLVKWYWGVPNVDDQVAKETSVLHEERMEIIRELDCKVIASKPIYENNKIYNEAFLWDKKYNPKPQTPNLFTLFHFHINSFIQTLQPSFSSSLSLPYSYTLPYTHTLSYYTPTQF